MDPEELKSFLQDRLLDLNPAQDISDGSPADIKVVAPTIVRLGVSPFQIPIRRFLYTRLANEFPDLDLEGAGSGYADIIAGPFELVLEPFKRELESIKISKSLANIDLLTEQEMDSLAANIFEYRRTGQLATCVVRLSFRQPQAVFLDGTVYCETASGLRFYTAALPKFTAEEMTGNLEAGLYYIDYLVQAEKEGSAYNIGVGDDEGVVTIVGVPTAVKIRNITSATDGLNREDNQEFLDRIVNSISERAPVTDRGIRSRLAEAFPSVQSLATIGFGDVEMVRDIIHGQVEPYGDGFGLGDVIQEGSAAAISQTVPYPVGTKFTAGFTKTLQLAGVSGLALGDVIHVDGLDRPIVKIYLTLSQVDVADYVVMYATQVGAGQRDLLPHPLGSDLPITNLYQHALPGPPFYGSGVGEGQFIAPLNATSVKYELDDFRVIASVLGNDLLRTNPEIHFRQYGRAQDPDLGVLVPPVHVLYYNGAESDDINLLLNNLVEGQTSGAQGTVRHIEMSAGFVVVDGCTGLFANSEAVLMTPPGTAKLVLANPTRTGGVSFEDATKRFHVDPMLGYAPTDSVFGGPVRIGDWIAVTDETGPTGAVYGMYKIIDVTSSYVEIGTGGADFYGPNAGYPPNTHGLPADEFCFSWTVIDADYFDDITKFFCAMNLGDPLDDYMIMELADYASLDGSFSFLDYNTPPSPYFYTVRRQLTEEEIEAALRLVISDIPGGILYPNTAQGTIVIEDEEVHVGGATDVYTKPEAVDQSFYTLPVVWDNDPLIEGGDLYWGTSSDRMESPEFLGQEGLIGSVLVVLEGEYTGPYRIIEADTTNGWVRIDAVLTNSNSAIRFRVTDEVVVDLSSPKVGRINYRDDLNTSLSKFVKSGTLGNYTDFEQFGVSQGDVLEILDGPDKGIHTIVNVLDGGETLQLANALKWVSFEVAFRIYRRMPPITRPLVRIRRIDLLDEDGSELGLTVPPKDPVDIRSGELSNAGLGTKIPNMLRTDPEVGAFSNVTDSGGVERGNLEDPSASFINEGVVPGDVVSVEEGDNAGYYIVREVLNPTNLYVEKPWPNPAATGYMVGGTGPDYKIGAPSTGTFRFYFLEPTFFELGPDSTMTDPEKREYRGDIFARAEVAAFTGEGADVESAPVGDDDAIESATIDFRLYEIAEGDQVLLTTVAVDSAVIGASSVNVSGSKLLLEFEGESARSVIFQGTSPIDLQKPGFPGGVKEQIEQEFPDLTVEVGPAPDYVLTFHSSREFWFRGGSAASTLGVGALENTSNAHPQSGRYKVFAISTDGKKLTLKTLDGATPVFDSVSRVRIVIQRTRVQRIGPKAMSQQQDATKLFYFDADIMSVRPGNEHNLVDSTEITVEGHRSFGYTLRSRNEALTFSDVEELDIALTPYLMEPVVGDDTFANLVLIPSRELQFSLDTSTLTGDVSSFLRSPFNRVICNSPLAKHMQPAYVRTAFTYTRGSSVTVIREDVITKINNLPPTQALSTYDIQGALDSRGAEQLENPIEILAVLHEMSRVVRTIRTKNRLSTPRTAHTIADVDGINIVRLAG